MAVSSGSVDDHGATTQMSLELDTRELDDLHVIDIWSFHRAERLKVHEARTLADRESRVVAVRRHYRNLLVVRSEHTARMETSRTSWSA